MPQYILRDLPNELWTRFTTRANAERWPLRALFLQLLDDYGSGRTRPSAQPPLQLPTYGWLRVHFRHAAQKRDFATLAPPQQWERLIDEVLERQTSAYDVMREIPDERRATILQWLHQTASSGLPGSRDFAMRPIAHSGKGPDLSIDRRVIQYEVIGLPPGQQAWIADWRAGGSSSWKILRVVDGDQGEWEGAYPTADEALGVLEHEVKTRG